MKALLDGTSEVFHQGTYHSKCYLGRIIVKKFREVCAIARSEERFNAMLERLECEAEETDCQEENVLVVTGSDSVNVSIIDVFKHKILRKSLFIMFLNWVAVTLGLQFFYRNVLKARLFRAFHILFRILRTVVAICFNWK